MADQDDEDDKRVRSNAAPGLHPPGVSRSGYAPPGAVGTDSKAQRESDLVVGPVYMQDGDKLSGPYHLLRVDPNSLVDDGKNPAPGPEQDNRNRIHFHETDDAEVNRFHQERGEIMVPKDGPPGHGAATPESTPERDGTLDRLYDQAKESGPEQSSSERDQDLDRLYAIAKDENAQAQEPDGDHDHERDAHDRDDQDLSHGDDDGHEGAGHGDDDDRRSRPRGR